MYLTTAVDPWKSIGLYKSLPKSKQPFLLSLEFLTISVAFYFGFQVGFLSTNKLKQQAGLDTHTQVYWLIAFISPLSPLISGWTNIYALSMSSLLEMPFTARTGMKGKEEAVVLLQSKRFSTIVSVSQSGIQTLVKEPRPEINSSCNLWR